MVSLREIKKKIICIRLALKIKDLPIDAKKKIERSLTERLDDLNNYTPILKQIEIQGRKDFLMKNSDLMDIFLSLWFYSY